MSGFYIWQAYYHTQVHVHVELLVELEYWMYSVLVWSAYVDDIFVVPFLLGVDGFKRRAIGSVLSIVGIYR